MVPYRIFREPMAVCGGERRCVQSVLLLYTPTKRKRYYIRCERPVRVVEGGAWDTLQSAGVRRLLADDDRWCDAYWNNVVTSSDEMKNTILVGSCSWLFFVSTGMVHFWICTLPCYNTNNMVNWMSAPSHFTILFQRALPHFGPSYTLYGTIFCKYVVPSISWFDMVVPYNKINTYLCVRYFVFFRIRSILFLGLFGARWIFLKMHHASHKQRTLLSASLGTWK